MRRNVAPDRGMAPSARRDVVRCAPARARNQCFGLPQVSGCLAPPPTPWGGAIETKEPKNQRNIDVAATLKIQTG